MTKLDCILLVDDSEADNFLHRMVIEEVGCAEHIESAEHGEIALAYLRDAHAGRVRMPQLIVLDINMPVMNGWEFLDHCDRENLIGEDTLIVAMVSTSQNPSDAERARSCPHVRQYIPKPLGADDLRALLEEREKTLRH